MSAHLNHVSISCVDLPATAALYGPMLAAIGLDAVIELADEEEDPNDVANDAVGYGPADGGIDGAVLWLVRDPSGRVTAGAHLALRVGDESLVERAFGAGISAGFRARQAPRRWEIFRAGYYGASVEDRAGNVIEVYAVQS